jgi:hypothetical protein
VSQIWLELKHWTVPLYPFMCQVKLGQHPGLYVYYVQLENQYVYVGQTYNGVRLRLWQHVSQSSILGNWLIKNEFTKPDPVCGIIRISDCMDAAERYYISVFDPLINVVRYKSSITLPPIERAAIKHIDITDRGGLVARGAVSGAKNTTTLEYQSNDPNPLAGLYERAYRDPNHPDLRKPS